MRSLVLSAGLAAALLPGTCSQIESLSGTTQLGPPYSVAAPLDDGFTIKGLPLVLQAVDAPPEEDEPVDVPDNGGGST